MSKKTVCLSMIVKNESKCIARCLNSLKDNLDYWIICDTGSTDNTIEIIKETMKGIPGEVHQHEWEDFATNRNKALDLARDKADYTLIIDADDRLVVEKENLMENLTADAYRIKIRHGGIEYYRPQLISNKIPYKYAGVLHEYIELPQCRYEVLEGCYMQTSFDGARSRNPVKFLDDAKLLEKALQKEPDNTRYMFYLAQSYKDFGDNEKAIEWYEKRAESGGWIEEIYISLLEIAKAKERLNRPIYEIECAYLKAFYTYPLRREAPYHLSRFFRTKGLFNKGYCYAREALAIKKPEETLFGEEECYSWRVHDELAVNAFYVEQYEDGLRACKKILEEQNSILPDELKRIKDNFNFFVEKIVNKI